MSPGAACGTPSVVSTSGRQLVVVKVGKRRDHGVQVGHQCAYLGRERVREIESHYRQSRSHVGYQLNGRVAIRPAGWH